MDNYAFVRPLGKGSFGRVDLYIDTTTNEYVAIKKIEQFHGRKEKDILDFISTLTKQKNLPLHKNILEIKNILVDRKHVYIISEYIQNTVDLNEYLEQERNYIDLFNIMHQIADALRFVHNLGIVHRDIKTDNILMKGITPILIDFGAACVYDIKKVNLDYTNVLCEDRFGSPFFAAPELLFEEEIPILERSYHDIYSLGVVFFFIMNRKYPYEDKDLTDEEFFEFVQTNLPENSNSGFSKIDEIIDSMLSRDPLDRPSLNKILEKLTWAIKNY